MRDVFRLYMLYVAEQESVAELRGVCGACYGENECYGMRDVFRLYVADKESVTVMMHVFMPSAVIGVMPSAVIGVMPSAVIRFTPSAVIGVTPSAVIGVMKYKGLSVRHAFTSNHPPTRPQIP